MLIRSSRQQIINHGGEWLRRFPWQWFLTLTFRRPSVSTTAAERHFKTYMADSQQDPIYFFVIEKHSIHASPHLHSLVGRVDALADWHHGISEILPYDPTLGAAFYCMKFLTAPSVWWDIQAKPSDLLSSKESIA